MRGAKFMTMDISNFYLMTPLKHPQNIYVSALLISRKKSFVNTTHNKVTTNSFIHLKVVKGMYGLPQAGLLAKNCLNND